MVSVGIAFLIIVCRAFENIVPNRRHVSDLEQRQQALEDEIANTLRYCSTDDLMIVDLKLRMLHLKNEVKRLRQQATLDRSLH